MPEHVDGDTEDHAGDTPTAAYHEFTQDQTDKEGDSSAVRFQPAMLEDYSFDCPAYKYGEPHPVHVIIASERIGYRVDIPPQEPRPHRHQKEGKSHPDPHKRYVDAVSEGQLSKPVLQVMSEGMVPTAQCVPSET